MLPERGKFPACPRPLLPGPPWGSGSGTLRLRPVLAVSLRAHRVRVVLEVGSGGCAWLPRRDLHSRGARPLGALRSPGPQGHSGITLGLLKQEPRPMFFRGNELSLAVAGDISHHPNGRRTCGAPLGSPGGSPAGALAPEPDGTGAVGLRADTAPGCCVSAAPAGRPTPPPRPGGVAGGLGPRRGNRQGWVCQAGPGVAEAEDPKSLLLAVYANEPIVISYPPAPPVYLSRVPPVVG